MYEEILFKIAAGKNQHSCGSSTDSHPVAKEQPPGAAPYLHVGCRRRLRHVAHHLDDPAPAREFPGFTYGFTL